MNVFDNLNSEETDPFSDDFPRTYRLIENSQDRKADYSAHANYKSLGTFKGARAQLVQRVTTNLLTIGANDALMQQSAFRIYTEINTTHIVRKGQYIQDATNDQDPANGKKYRVIAPYYEGGSYALAVTEIDD